MFACKTAKRLTLSLFLATASLSPLPTAAQDNFTSEHLAAARETALAVGAARQMELVLPLIMNQMERTFAQFNPELTAEFASVFDTLRPKFATQMDVFVNKMAKVYARDFSIDELNIISTFYNSEAGQKYIGKERALEKSNARIGREFSEQLGRDIDAEVRSEMKKRGHAL